MPRQAVQANVQGFSLVARAGPAAEAAGSEDRISTEQGEGGFWAAARSSLSAGLSSLGVSAAHPLTSCKVYVKAVALPSRRECAASELPHAGTESGAATLAQTFGGAQERLLAHWRASDAADAPASSVSLVLERGDYIACLEVYVQRMLFSDELLGSVQIPVSEARGEWRTYSFRNQQGGELDQCLLQCRVRLL